MDGLNSVPRGMASPQFSFKFTERFYFKGDKNAFVLYTGRVPGHKSSNRIVHYC